MNSVPLEQCAYDLVVTYPAMEFSARVARRGKYSAPIIDEFVIRVVHAAGESSVASIGGLLRLTGAQLESFIEPMIRSGLLVFTDSGLVALGPQGQQAMRQAAGDPPRLSRVEEATEVCSIDVIDNAFTLRPTDRRPSLRYLDIFPSLSTDRSMIREVVRHKLHDDYFEHQQYLEIYGLRAAVPRQIEYVIDLDDGVGDRAELSARVALDSQGVPFIEYPDLRSADQQQKRRGLIGQIELSLLAMKSRVTPQAQQFFIGLVERALRELQLDESNDGLRDREFWIDEGVLVTGRLESRSRVTADHMIDQVIAESGLMRGDRERSVGWVVAVFPESDLFVAGREYRSFLEGALGRLRRRSPRLRAVAVFPNGEGARGERQLSDLFDARVSGVLNDPSLAGIDGLFIPDELAYVVCSDITSSRGVSGVPRPRNLVTSRLDAVREVTRQVFCSPCLAKVNLDRITDAEWQELSSALRRIPSGREGRLLKLKPGSRGSAQF